MFSRVRGCSREETLALCCLWRARLIIDVRFRWFGPPDLLACRGVQAARCVHAVAQSAHPLPSLRILGPSLAEAPSPSARARHPSTRRPSYDMPRPYGWFAGSNQVATPTIGSHLALFVAAMSLYHPACYLICSKCSTKLSSFAGLHLCFVSAAPQECQLLTKLCDAAIMLCQRSASCRGHAMA